MGKTATSSKNENGGRPNLMKGEIYKKGIVMANKFPPDQKNE